MKIAFFGTSPFAVPALDRLAERPGVEIVAVITQPDRPSGRGHKLAATPVKIAAAARALAVFSPTKLRPFAVELTALAPELCVVASYGRIVPQVLLDAVPLWLNVHPSLLPQYRGATPIQSAIRDGCSVTGVTIIAMDAGMDTGDIVAQTAPVPIGADETYGELHDRLAATGADLLLEALDAYVSGTLRRVPQDDAQATVTRPLGKADRALLPFAAEHAAAAAVNLVRSLAPKPGAVLESSTLGDPVIVLGAHILPEPVAGEPGAVLLQRERIVVRTHGDGAVVIDRVVPPGKRSMSSADFLRGRVTK